MSPLGKPTPDGEITRGSRHYGGKTLGAATLWNCPACGKQNDGRVPEQGCGHCGAGDPTKSRAGRDTAHERSASEGIPADVRATATPPRRPASAAVGPTVDVPQTLTVYRLIEYVIRKPALYQDVLRRSLVGTLDMAWGSLTATIVDTLDAQQEDRLRMARMQPGVWLGNELAMQEQHTPPYRPPTSYQYRKRVETVKRMETLMPEPPEMPDTGLAWTAQQEVCAHNIREMWGNRVAHTLALALSSIAEELAANSEPEKFLSRDECLQLANALMHQIPAEWAGDPPHAEEETDASR